LASGTLKELRDNLENEADLVDNLLEATGGQAPDGFQADMRSLARQARELSAFIDRAEAGTFPVRIAVVGDFSSGKSSFINSVLEDPALCPERADPTTSLVTTFIYGPEERIIQHHGDGRAIPVSRSEYATQVQAPHDGSAPIHFTFHLPNPLLMGLELVDTPGFNNGANPTDTQVTTGIMREADAFFYLVDANTGTIAETGLDQVRLIKRESDEAQVFLLISKADQKSNDGLERIKARYRKDHPDLFQDRILTYSSTQIRPGLDAREDLAALFHTFQRDKAMLAKGTLRRRVRAHRDLRLIRARHLQETLLELMDCLTEETGAREAILKKMLKRLVEVYEGEIKHFNSELAVAHEKHLVPTEIKGSGWFWDDAQLAFSPNPFKDDIRGFDSFKIMEKALHGTILALFGYTRKDLHESTIERCVAARHECARIAEHMALSQWQPDLTKRFDYLSEAQKGFAAVRVERNICSAKAVWGVWDNCVKGICAELEREFLGAPSEALNRRRETLAGGIDQWKFLIETMPEPQP